MDIIEFGIVYKVLGGADAALRSIGANMQQVHSTALRTASVGLLGAQVPGQLAAASAGAQNLVGSVSDVSMALRQSTQELAQWGTAAFDAMQGVAEAGIATATRIEKSNASLAFATRKNNMDLGATIKTLDEIALKTVLTRDQLTNMVSELAMQKINLFDEAVNNLAVTMANGEKATVSAAEVLQDTMSFSGRDIQNVTFWFKEVASGRKIAARGFGNLMNMDKKEIAAWNKELDKTNGKQERFNKLMELSAQRVGGSTLALKDTLYFIQAQVDDWKDKIMNDIFRDALPVIRDLTKDIGAWALELSAGDKLKGIREAVRDIAQSAADGARQVFAFTQRVVEFVRLHPWVLKLAVGFATTSLGVSKLVSGLGKLGGLVFNLRVLFSALGPALGVIAPIAGYLVLIGGGLALVGTVLARMLVGGDSFADTWSRVGTVLNGVWQVIKNMNSVTGATFMDEDTAKRLEKAGLLGTVENIGRVIFRVTKFVEGMFQAFEDNWPKIRDAGERVFTSLETAVRNLAQLVGIQLGTIAGGLEGAPDSAVERWISFGVTVGDVMTGLILKVTAVIEKVTQLAARLTELWRDSHLEEITSFLSTAGKYTPSGALFRYALPEIYGDEPQAEATVASNVARVQSGRVSDLLAKADPNAEGVAKPRMTTAASQVAATLNPKEVYENTRKGAYDGMTAAMRDNPPVLQADGRNLTDFIARYAQSSQEDER